MPVFTDPVTGQPFFYGEVLTVGQWMANFAAKQNVLGYTPVNKAGDTMLGRLRTAASGTIAGFSILPGTAPGSPNDGDMWVTAAGLFVQINGTTIGPLVSASSQFLPTASYSGNHTVTLGQNGTSLIVNASGGDVTITVPKTFGAPSGNFRCWVERDAADASSNKIFVYDNTTPTPVLIDAITVPVNLGQIPMLEIRVNGSAVRSCRNAA